MSRINYDLVLLRVVHGVKTLRFVDTATTVRLFITVRTEYGDNRTVDGRETKYLLVHCRRYHMEVNARNEFRAEFFDETFSIYFLPLFDFCTVRPTMVDDIITPCSAGSVMTARVFITVCAPYLGSRKVGDD